MRPLTDTQAEILRIQIQQLKFAAKFKFDVDDVLYFVDKIRRNVSRWSHKS
jgi:hypothetical protein